MFKLQVQMFGRHDEVSIHNFNDFMNYLVKFSTFVGGNYEIYYSHLSYMN